MLLAESLNCGKASPRVKGDQQVTFLAVPVFLNGDLVPQFGEQRGPAFGSGPVSCLDLSGRGRD